MASPLVNTGAQRAIQTVTDTASSWSSTLVLGNPVRAWITSAAIVLAILLLFWIVRSIVLRRLTKISERTHTRVDDVVVGVLSGVRFWVMLLVAIAAASAALTLPGTLEKVLRGLAVLALGIQAMIASRVLIAVAIETALKTHRQPDGSPDPTVASGVGILRFIAMLVIGAVVLVLALENMDFKATPLITSLGVGGIAVALAVQNILGDLFGSLTIIFDKPFVVGDTIKVGEHVGTVERIGIKTTRVRSVNGEELVFANSDLLSSRIQNFKSLQTRRMVSVLAVEYETSPALLQRIPTLVQEAVESQAQTRFERCHFRDFGAYALNFELVYVVTTNDFDAAMRAQAGVNLALHERFNQEKITFALPTQVAVTRASH
jgi:small-conductance mechanosensitive channel